MADTQSPHTGEQVKEADVPASVYESAVKGRQDFRQAYRDLLPLQRAAQAISDHWRKPGGMLDTDAFYDLINALDIAVTGGGPTTPEMRAQIEARLTTAARQPEAMADQSTEARLSAAEIETYARLMARNLDAGDSRMLRENIVCLLFRSRHGRDPSWEELEPAFAALAALRSRTGDQSNG